jgi:hypothetical protein
MKSGKFNELIFYESISSEAISSKSEAGGITKPSKRASILAA